MVKIRCDNHYGRENLTHGKTYETPGLDKCGQFKIVDDFGDVVHMNQKHFEDENGNIQYV